MKLTKSKIAKIIREELDKMDMHEIAPALAAGLAGAGGLAAGSMMGDRDEEAAAPPENRDVATLAQAMEKHPDVRRAIDMISNADEAREAITYLITKLGEKNLPVAMIITSMAKSLHQARQAE